MIGHGERKLEFFIGATKKDLGNARLRIIEAVLEARHIPSGMELWAAGTQPLLTDIARRISRCDAHIIILGARYGTLVEGEKPPISFTEWEFRQSEKAGRPIIAFILKEEEYLQERRKVEKEAKKKDKEEKKRNPAEKTKKKLAGKRSLTYEQYEKNITEHLNVFRKTLGKQIVRYFSNNKTGIESLAGDCINAIHELINRGRPSEDIGWIRATSRDAVTLRQIRQNRFLESELNRLQEFSTLGERVVLDSVAKDIQARVFWETMQGRIRRYGYKNLFFESGSTIAYVSDAFEKYVLKGETSGSSWVIHTNNVMTLLQMLLYTDLDVNRLPACSLNPKDKYGAIFPREWACFQEPPPSLFRPLHKVEADAVRRFQNQELRPKLVKPNGKAILLATTSGWDLADRKFRGPHVGSHPNMLYKRALFTLGQPVVIFLSAEKLGDPFQIGKCYPVFGGDITLEEALKKYPLAVCIGYDQTLASPTGKPISKKNRIRRNNPVVIRSTLASLQFNIFYTPQRDESSGVVIASNQAFTKLLPND